MGRMMHRLYKTDRARDFDHETVCLSSTHRSFKKLTRSKDRYVRMQQIYETIDRQKYQWVVVLVAGVGFFLDGYTVSVSYR